MKNIKQYSTEEKINIASSTVELLGKFLDADPGNRTYHDLNVLMCAHRICKRLAQEAQQSSEETIAP